ncbi:MAG: hypothetical protein MZV64_31210, partial [Ignavibacteriales bacterium]|nr:hypothetical protein [Ignavibacteriales bacterium]
KLRIAKVKQTTTNGIDSTCMLYVPSLWRQSHNLLPEHFHPLSIMLTLDDRSLQRLRSQDMT